MYKKRLLERIRDVNNLKDGAEPHPHSSLSDEIRSILGYLNKILMTRQGSVEIADDFGVPDYTGLRYDSVENSAGLIEDTIQSTVTKYEPRLKNAIVKFDGQDSQSLSLLFKAEAILNNDPSAAVSFTTEVTPEGKTDIMER